MYEGKRDPVSGQMTTGHEWNGIEELDTPVPRVVLIFLGIAFVFSLVCWLLFPSFPLVSTFTKGLLGVDQQQLVSDQVAAAAAERTPWESEILSRSFAEIQADPGLMLKAKEAGHTLFADNCAVCHGTSATGGPGFPDLTSKSWLWGGDIDNIAETIRVGINSGNDGTRVSQMMAFGRDALLDRRQIGDVIAYVRSLSGTAGDGKQIAAGKEVFTANCVTCHGEDGKGMADVGAPDLTDKFWIYGGDLQSLYSTIYSGRQGHMPHWDGRLSPAQLKVLALYVASLEAGKP